jgi:uridine phosphorylase
MHALAIQDTIVLNKNLSIPSHGIICAHPGRVERIAQEFLECPQLHTNYRGYQIYVGLYQGAEVFVANTGIGAPAAAFLLEELIAFGAKRIIRLGSNDSNFKDYALTLVQETTLPCGLKLDYNVGLSRIKINDYLEFMLQLKACKFNIPLKETFNQHIDGYYVAHRLREGSSDMESGALYLLGHYYGIQYASVLLSYPKHGEKGEYGGAKEAFELEEKGIRLVLEVLKS